GRSAMGGGLSRRNSAGKAAASAPAGKLRRETPSASLGAWPDCEAPGCYLRRVARGGRAPMNILGISAYYHDSAACLVQDGEIVAAAQEERFTRKKHDHDFPKHAVEYCLREADITTGDIDSVVFYDKPILKFDRLLETY